MRLAGALLLGLTLGAPSACAPPPSDAAEAARGVRVLALPDGVPAADPAVPVVRVEVVASREDRARGLGGRRELGADSGMLFVYRTPGPRSFWMQDCHLALDIAFLGQDGSILELATLPPGAGLPHARVPRAGCEGDVAFVLETNAGWFAERRVRVGDRVDVGLAVRGARPE